MFSNFTNFSRHPKVLCRSKTGELAIYCYFPQVVAPDTIDFIKELTIISTKRSFTLVAKFVYHSLILFSFSISLIFIWVLRVYVAVLSQLTMFLIDIFIYEILG